MPVTIKGDKKVAANLRAYGEKARDIEEVWPKVGNYLRRTMQEQFATEGARLGKPWRPLKPEYKLWKMRHGFNRRILQKTGAMRLEFTSDPMNIERYEGNTAYFGSSSQIAKWQSRGTHRHGKRIIPPRPILTVTAEVRREVKQIMADHITGRA